MKKLLGILSCLGAAHGVAVDATRQPPVPEQGYFHFGSATNPAGERFGINSQYLTLDGKPVLPVMGEFHYSRVPEAEWDGQLAKMKAAGVSIVSSYIIWQHHEEKPGVFDWSGDRDLHHFLELCRKHGLLVVLRLGPWSHAEVRFGGLPDWVVNAMPTRRNDPQYLAAVAQFYQQIAGQAHGELWKDGGPVVGVQIENEYNLTGPGQGRAHIAALKQMARQAGFDVPLYTVTGWDNTVYPKHEVTPVFGGYPDEPWDRSATKLPPKAVYQFEFTTRVDKGLGAETHTDQVGDAETEMDHTPFLGAEFGGGVPTMYRRRPIIEPDDVAAMLPVGLGSGVNLYGYYMFQGGRNPAGTPSRQESTATGGYNDLPMIGYDFGAPLGEYGQAHPVLDRLRPFHYFLESFGPRLAPMAVHAPEQQPSGPDDLSTLRWSVRSLGHSGFVFVNNHVRGYAMPVQHQVQFDVRLPGEALHLPARPLDIPADAYFIWPFHFDLNGIDLAWATAQPLTQLGDHVYVFAAQAGIPVELAFDPDQIASLRWKSQPITGRVQNGHLLLDDLQPGADAWLEITGKNGKQSVVWLITPDQARHAWVTPIDGVPHLLETTATPVTDGHDLRLDSIGTPHFTLESFPALGKNAAQNGHFFVYQHDAVEQHPRITVDQVRQASPAPVVVIGGAAQAAVEPKPESWSAAAAWQIKVGDVDWSKISNLWLNISYQGDSARLFSGTQMLDDEFFNGQDWQIALKRFAPVSDLTLGVMPLRADAPVYFEAAVKAQLPQQGQVAQVRKIELVPEYEWKVK